MQTTTATDLTRQFAAAVTALCAVSKDVADFQTADDAALVELSRLAAQEKQLADAHLALIAGEIAARSTREMGNSGLAYREGFRSTEELLRTTTGSSGREATTAVRVGRLVREAATAGSIDPVTGEKFEAAQPWLADVAAAVSNGSLSVAAADAIRAGLGSPTENVSADALAETAWVLCLEATVLDVDRLLKRARELRDDLDAAGIADPEREWVEKRSLRHFMLSNGMGRVVWDLDPESYAVVTELYDRATSPKRGVRFVDGDRKETAERILADPRTIEQLASDTLLGLLQAGADADSSQLLGTGAAAIRVLVTQKTVKAREGYGRIEGTAAPISLETVERLTCGGDLRTVTIDSFGQPLDVGKEQRFFTPKQRIALAVRDGGCLFGDCDRPPSMTEAHHINFWKRDDGRTDLKDGVLLCKFHHLLCHNNGWEIERVGTEYFLVPPPDVDPSQTRRPMPSKSPAMRDLRRELAGH
ncbi:hypothetical protein GCM10027413_27570 [Conyzicola nivalis]|uniref:HNH nuclease domain-containing protein n=1 Tax=Conyzicola nivalis TaxID=1477021 RepID=A0A916WNM9_9MICO|nr:HNH endonuclease signature motif containing protein [Conyzicola nivalis]GGB14958.1 hypothetical protein GCM10010979_31940 [Conyzicola nivalis]